MTHWIQPVVSLEHGKSLDAWDDESLDPARTMLAQEFVSQAGRFMTIGKRVAIHGDSLGENRPHNGQNKSGLEMFGIYVVFVQMFFTQHPLLAIQTGPKAVKWHHALHSLVRLQMSCCFIIHLPYIIFFFSSFRLVSRRCCATCCHIPKRNLNLGPAVSGRPVRVYCCSLAKLVTSFRPFSQ